MGAATAGIVFAIAGHKAAIFGFGPTS
jgi:hypothetical protein